MSLSVIRFLGDSGEGGLLDFQQLGDAVFSCGEHLVELGRGKDMFLTASLDFDEVQCVGHDDIHVHARVLVFGIVQINEDFAIYDAYADGSDAGFDGQGGSFALSNKPGCGELDGDRGPCDGCGACASVSLQDIAIDPEGAGAEFIEIDNGA